MTFDDGSSLNCEYELDNIEVDIEGETYIVEIMKHNLEVKSSDCLP